MLQTCLSVLDLIKNKQVVFWLKNSSQIVAGSYLICSNRLHETAWE